jgi:hypothetical protein
MILMAITQCCRDLVARIRWRFVLARLDSFANISREELISELEEARERVLAKKAVDEPLPPPIAVRLTPEQGDMLRKQSAFTGESYRTKRIIGHCFERENG